MTPTPEQVADLLDDAADLIERDGWAQGWLRDPDGHLCATGAVAAAATTDDLLTNQTLRGLVLDPNGPVRAGIRAAEDTIGGGLSFTLPMWNDAEGRSEQQVLDLLRTTAKRQRIAANQAGGTP